MWCFEVLLDSSQTFELDLDLDWVGFDLGLDLDWPCIGLDWFGLVLDWISVWIWIRFVVDWTGLDLDWA